MHSSNITANKLIQAYLDGASAGEIAAILEECHPYWVADAKRKARHQITIWTRYHRRFAWCTVSLPPPRSS